MELGLKGKRALVMAASRGLGFASALGLAREGCKLVICSRDQERIEAAANTIRTQTGAEVKRLLDQLDGKSTKVKDEPTEGEPDNTCKLFSTHLKDAVAVSLASAFELQSKASFRRITGAGLAESRVHDVSIVKSAPNYWED